MDQSHHSREAGECNHFVMRQYAIDMRKKDGKKCLAFGSDGEIEQPLPPMVVPKYKYWCCQNCMNRNGAVSSLEDIAVFCRRCESEMISETISTPSPPNKEMEIVRSEERTIVENATANLSTEVVQMRQIGQEKKGADGIKGNTDVRGKEIIVVISDSEGDVDGVSAKDRIDHATVGRGVLSLLSAEENKIFHENQRRNYNRYPGESSVSHKSTTGPSVDESLKNVMDKFSHGNVEVSPPPSNKNVPVVQNSDISQLRNANVIALPKATEKRIMPWLQTEFPTTRPDLVPTNRNKQGSNETGRSWSPWLSSDQMPFADKHINMGMDSLKRTPTEHQFFPKKSGTEINQPPFNVHAEDLVEKELFPKFSLKSRTGGERSSSLNSTHVPVKLFGTVQDEEKAKSPIVPAVSKSCSDQIGSLTLGGPTFMKGISGFMKDQPRTDICTKNVNPADFSYPNAGNPFMISGAQLKVRKRPCPRGKTVKENENGGKKQKGNERDHHRPT